MSKTFSNKKVRLELKGFKNNRITVLKFDFIRDGKSYWKCLCSCGNKFTAMGKNIKNGNTKSCGCLQREKIGKLNRLPPGESAFNRVYHTYYIGAKERNLFWDLSKEKVRELTKGICFYCGREPSGYAYCNREKYGNGAYVYNGIDRVNNDIGYIESNVVSCCKDCNTMKMKLTVDEFFGIVEKIYKRHINNV